TQPVLNAQGEVVYVISGSINLKERNFLGAFSNMKFGQTGFMFITNTDGTVIDHPLKSRILTDSNEGNPDPATQRALAGFEGTFASTDHLGARGLYAFQRIHQTDWLLGSIYPQQEAFARIEEIEHLAWAGALLLTFLAGAITFLVVRAELTPLARLHEHMQISRATSNYVPARELPRADEIGDMSRTFDSLMLERQLAQERLQSSAKFLRDVTDNLPAVVAYFDRDQRCLFSNKAGLGMRGKAQADVGTMKIDEALPAWIHAQLVPQFAKVLAGTPTRFEGTYDRSGKEGFFQCHLVPDARGGGEVVGYYVMTFDITRQKIAERERAAGEARIRTITDNLPALVSHVDASLRYTFVNAHVRALHDGVELVGRSMPAVRGSEDFAIVEPYVRRVLAGEAVTFEKSGDRARGIGQNWYQSHFIPDLGAEGTVQGFYAMTFDITARRELEQRLAELARVDVLTQLPNRLALNDLLPQAMARARRSGDTLAVMFLDIDNFKTINDTLGHAGGDAVLAEFARRLLASVRTTDTVVRLAGDEFVVILENLGTSALAGRLADKIVKQVGRRAFQVDARALDVTTSIGIALFEAGDAPANAAGVLARADVALYGAKAAGRNTYQFAVPV
ncbi:MAG: diguanylate cyclase, partial [Variovorax sp.]